MHVFIKPVDSAIRKSKMLFLMGATWHTQCMFDVNCNEDSFADLLHQKNIETYAFDNIGLGASVATGYIGNAHQINVGRAKELIHTYNIDTILAYSYGVTILMELMPSLEPCVKNIILLDPYPALDLGTLVFVDNGDKKIINKNYVSDLLIKHQSSASPEMARAYLSNLFASDNLVVPSYPVQVLTQQFNHFHNVTTVDTFKSAGAKILFTSSSRELTKDQFPADMCTILNDCSHWVLIEPARYMLADVVDSIIKSTLAIPAL